VSGVNTRAVRIRRLAERGRHVEALERLEWDRIVRPSDPELLLLRARLREWADDVDGALADCEALLALHPALPDAWLTRGSLHARRGERMTALESFRRARRLAPDSAAPEHLVASVGGRGFEAPLRGEVTELFEACADRFDQHLVGELNYRGHLVLPAAVRDHAGASSADWRVLDLGCGTGLCGAALRPLASWLAGVDLSPRSVVLARERLVYDLVWVADLVYALATTPDADLDLVLAADVLGYLGALDVAVAESARALRPGGRLAFTVEARDGGPGYVLGPSRRFSYTRGYLEGVLATHGLFLASHSLEALRHEAGHDVVAHVVLAQKER
jgi:predicted TPR repeat methyltransferase